jgi:adenylate kinase
VLGELGVGLDRVINFQVSREDVVKRLSGRRSCPKCQATFHVEFAPPKKAGVCDRCGEALIQRTDDTREAIETRLKVYEEQTAPLISFYETKGMLSHLDGAGAVEAVYQKLTKVLAASMRA